MQTTSILESHNNYESQNPVCSCTLKKVDGKGVLIGAIEVSFLLSQYSPDKPILIR